MSMRQKTKRRLIFLLAATVGVALLLGGGYWWRQQRHERQIMDCRNEGLAALQEKNYGVALYKLYTYLQRYDRDAEIMLSYVEARTQVEEPNGKHLLDAINMLQRYLQIKPNDLAARHRLLELYINAGFNSEALATADDLLSRQSNDVTVLKYKTAALTRLRRISEALKVAQETGQIAPLDLDNQATILVLLSKQGQTPAAVIQHAEELQRKHPSDPRFALLVSIAHSMAGEKTAAISWAKGAAAQPISDADVASLLIHQLDVLEQFADADRLQAHEFEREPTPEHRLAWVNRLWQRGRYAEILTQTDDAPTAAPAVADDLIAMRLLALSKLNRQDDAKKLLDVLAQRGKTNQQAADWAVVLAGPAGAQQPDARARILSYAEALRHNARNPLFYYFMGQAQSEAGERDLALQALQRAVQLSPPWAAPWIGASRLLLISRRFGEAFEAAQAARLRAPDDPEALVQLAQAWSTVVHLDRPKEAPQLLAYLADIRQRFPHEQRTLPIEVLLKARFEKPESAKKLILQTLDSQNQLDQQILLQLAMASGEAKLSLEDACYQRYEKLYGLTPDLAFAKASQLLEQQKAADGLAVIEKAKPSVGVDDQTWRTVRARYFDMMNDPRAKTEWVALAEAHPTDLSLQWMVLNAKSVQSDRNFLNQTINRIHAQTGDQSLAWRFARARWILDGQSSEQELAEASVLLGEISRTAPDLLPPRLLQATALEKLGNIKGAIEQLQAAINLRPGSTQVALDLARLLIAQGDAEQARQYATKVAQNAAATHEEKYKAAAILTQAGSYDQALTILKQLYGPENTDQTADLLLAALYRQKNQPDKAEAVCRKLLEKPTPTVIQFASDLLASQGRLKEAQETLAKLDSLASLQPGTKEMIRAAYLARYGTPQQAQAEFLAATTAAPRDPLAWRQRILFTLASGDIAGALACAQEAERQLADQSPGAALLQQRRLVEKMGTDPAKRPLIMELLNNTADNRGVLEALQILADAQDNNETSRQTLPKLRRVADHFPKILSLQSMVIQLYTSSGQIDEAIAMATRSMDTFPTSPEMAKMATETLTEAGRWDEVLGIARQWQQRSPQDQLPADLAIANASLQLGKSRAVLEQLKPYLNRALAEPENYQGLLLLYMQALLQDGQTKTAEQIMRPLLPKGPYWRVLWMRLASQSMRDAPSAQAWMDHVANIIPENAVNEQVVLAESWRKLGAHFKNESWNQVGHKILENLANRADATPEALLAQAILRESEGDTATAETYYRRALEKKPDDIFAQNNLAMVLVQRGKNLQEALNLIDQAIRFSPQIPNFYDTRASVQLALQDYDGAIASISEAVRLDANNLEWHLQLSWILLRGGYQDRAKREMIQVESLNPDSRTLSTNSRQRLQILRTTLAKNTAAAR
ncbi:MAG: tetratricopeptide repeat protein [Phycisphaerales bacterium]|nr:tetratricopeptide repeat protein [Phycisphaerales bacterium]